MFAFAAAWVVTASLVAAGVDVVDGSVSPLQAFLIGAAVAAAPTVTAAWLNRKKVRADIASEVTDAAVKLVEALERRVVDATAAAAAADHKAELATRVEHECQQQLALVRLEIAALKLQRASGGD